MNLFEKTIATVSPVTGLKRAAARQRLNIINSGNAAVLRVENSFSTRDREAQEMNGSDFYKNVKQRRGEERLMREVEEIKTEQSRPDG